MNVLLFYWGGAGQTLQEMLHTDETSEFELVFLVTFLKCVYWTTNLKKGKIKQMFDYGQNIFLVNQYAQ